MRVKAKFQEARELVRIAEQKAVGRAPSHREEPVCSLHDWYGEPGRPRPPLSQCPYCREARARRKVPDVIEVPDDRIVRSRAMVAENPQVALLFAENQRRNLKPGQPLPGSREEAEGLAAIDDARDEVSWGSMTQEERRRASERYWRTASSAELGLPLGSVARVQHEMNAYEPPGVKAGTLG
jgi:hypothetical protein